MTKADMKRIIMVIGMGSLILPVIAPAPALARKSGTTREKCGRAVAREAEGRFNANDFALLSDDIREISADENLMTGTAQAGGRTFRYECTYNISNGRTYGVNLRAQGGGSGWGGGNGGSWNGGGQRLPGGSWARSCRGAEMRGGVLYAECKNINGKWRNAQIVVRSCPANRLGNQNGQLACE